MYKITEKFFSIQGEGYWAGTPMAFVRLSQCPVGGPEGICKTWAGKEFKCDTGKSYHEYNSRQEATRNPGEVEHHPYSEVNETLSAEEILSWASARKHLCITGGEPFIYDLEPLISEDILVHIETSGTTPMPQWVMGLDPTKSRWITLSPKIGYKEEWFPWVDEFKILVSKDTLPFSIFPQSSRIYLQPIEDEDWEANTVQAIKLCEQLNLRLSIQTHKYLGLR